MMNSIRKTIKGTCCLTSLISTIMLTDSKWEIFVVTCKDQQECTLGDMTRQPPDTLATDINTLKLESIINYFDTRTTNIAKIVINHTAMSLLPENYKGLY
jgi:hypothetical protein